MKICKQCNQEKHESKFSKSKGTKDGLYQVCKACKKEEYLERYYEKHKDLIEKQCAKCNEVKPISEFYVANYHPSGFQAKCKQCYKTDKQELSKKYLALVNDRKKKIGCQRCGNKDLMPCAYDFHHLDPRKKSFAISQGYTLNIERLEKEFSKCVVLCRNCHAEIHELEKQGLKVVLIDGLGIRMEEDLPDGK